jgi:hypothetical protein
MMNSTQIKAYERFIKARNRVRIGRYGMMTDAPWVPLSDILYTIDIAGFNHPFYQANELWIEYKDAFAAWLLVEPEFRKEEKMSMIRGDYGTTDSWRDKQTQVKEIK